jgi:hypothetical protein
MLAAGVIPYTKPFIELVAGCLFSPFVNLRLSILFLYRLFLCHFNLIFLIFNEKVK